MSVLSRNGRNDAASSHILKFEWADYRNVPAFETFTTWLAKAAGLPVVRVELRTVRGHSYTEISRYDRIADQGGRIQRLHQEDFCQALGHGHERKYETDGGPSFADCIRLLRWQAFNWLAGNSDGHAKNLALLHGDGSRRLAPFYDLVCTRGIAGVDRQLAMTIGSQADPGSIAQTHWRALAQDCGVRWRFWKSWCSAPPNGLPTR